MPRLLVKDHTFPEVHEGMQIECNNLKVISKLTFWVKRSKS